MYETRFGLRQRPFPATPDSACYYPATSHERALTQLRQAFDEQQGLALLTGETGTGKTLLALCLLESLGDGVVSALLPNSHFHDSKALLQALLYDLGLPYEGASEQELRLRLTDCLLQNCKAGRRAIFVLDEAQHLSVDLLEELRLLSNIEAGAIKAVHILLIGHTDLLPTLRSPELAALQQRLEVRASVAALGVEEAADYLLHHLRRAGARPEALISDEALGLLARHTRGVPRLLNQTARQALVLADAAEADHVDVEAALEALAALGIEVGEEEAEVGGEGEGKFQGVREMETVALVADDGSCRLYDAPRQVL